ncbi:MAG: hypothetical protein ACTSXH_19465 [Promethearchaeota archaeon]
MISEKEKAPIRKIFHEINYKFLIILGMGIILRLISISASNIMFIRIYLSTDAYDYVLVAESILKGDYATHRPPSFPFFIIPFLLIFKEGSIAVLSATFVSGVILIIVSYLVFKRATLIIFENHNNKIKIGNEIGLYTSFIIAIDYPLVYIDGLSRRESFMMVLLILIFYFTFIRDSNGHDNDMTQLLIIGVLMAVFTLSHPTAGIFLFISLIVFFLISKIMRKDYLKFSNSKLLSITISFTAASLGWLLFCFFHFGDSFYTYTLQSRYFKIFTLDRYITIGLDGLKYGIPWELLILFNIFGVIFTLNSFIVVLIHHKKKA